MSTKSDKPVESQTVTLGETAVAELLKTGKALGAAQTPAGLQPFVIVPNGFQVHTLEPKRFLDVPDHIRQAVTLEDADSFIAYVKGFRTHTTRIFSTRPDLSEIAQGENGGAEFTALLDYHQGKDDPKAGRVKHVAKYPVPLSLEMVTWIGKNGVAQGQVEFVDFIEANCADLVSPTSAEMMEIALNFQEHREVEFQSKVDRVRGGRELKFIEKIDGGGQTGGSMRVPEGMELRLPVFEGGKPYTFRARLEYRAERGRLLITYHLQRPHDVFRVAHAELKAEIAAALELEILTGEAAPIASDAL